MSPALDMPLNRREAMTSLLAMLAFVLGTSDTEAGRPAFTDSLTEPVVQPLPSSSVDWGAQLRFFANDEHLPLPRIVDDIQAALTYDGRTLRMNLFLWPDPAWIDDVEQPNVPLGSFEFIGNPAPLLDRLSVDADAEWLEFEMRRAKQPSALCPTCTGHVARKLTCTTCNGAGWVFISPEAALRRIEREKGERQALIDAAMAADG